ncbi:MAG: hypothetical protein ACRECJ_04305 [Limisphaerales bacterium]
MLRNWILLFVFLLVIAVLPSMVIFAQEATQDKDSKELKQSAVEFIKNFLSYQDSSSAAIFSDSILSGFKRILEKDRHSSKDSLNEEDFYLPEILGVAFVNTDSIRAFIEVHTDTADDIIFIDFPHRVFFKSYFDEKREVEKVTRQVLSNFNNNNDQENYSLFSDSMLSGYKDLGIVDAKSYADSFKNVTWNRPYKILGTTFIHQDSSRVFVEETREDGVKYITFIVFVKQRDGWKYDGYDSRYICPY